MTRIRPIGYRLQKSSTRDKQLDIAKAWAADWQHQIFELLNRLDDAAGEDWQAFDAVNAELRKLCHRKFDALPNMLNILTSPLYNEQAAD